MTATITQLEKQLRRFSHFGFNASMKECFKRLPLYCAASDSGSVAAEIREPFRLLESLEGERQRAWAIATDGHAFVALAMESPLKTVGATNHKSIVDFFNARLRPHENFEQRAVDFAGFAERLGPAREYKIVDCTCDEETPACDDCNGTGKMAWTDQRPVWLKMNGHIGEVMVMVDAELVARCLLALPIETTLTSRLATSSRSAASLACAGCESRKCSRVSRRARFR